MDVNDSKFQKRLVGEQFQGNYLKLELQLTLSFPRSPQEHYKCLLSLPDKHFLHCTCNHKTEGNLKTETHNSVTTQAKTRPNITENAPFSFTNQ